MKESKPSAFEKFVKPLLAIHPEERAKTLLMFAYFFLVITLIYILKPVQRALFIHEFGAQKLSYAYIGEGLFLILVVSIYMKFAKKVSKGTFYRGILLFYISNLLLFWILFRTNLPHLSAFFYLWHAAFSITMTTVFWTLGNDLFNTSEAKRLFGLIMSGGSLGGIVGGAIAKALMHCIHCEDLLLLSAGILGLCLILVDQICKRYLLGNVASVHSAETSESTGEKKEFSKTPGLQLFLKSPYLLILCGIVMMAKMSSTIVDNQFNAIIANHITGKDALTEFFGGFFSSLNMISFLMQLCVTSLVLRLAGIGIALLLMPSGLLVLGLFNLFSPTLMSGVILRMFEGSTSVSVQQASKEVLYLPVPSEVRRRTKPLIDMLGYRLAKSMGGVLLGISAGFLKIPADHAGVLLLGIVPIWMGLVWKMKALYPKTHVAISS